ncbi:S8/S53 family peptidase [Mesorhizobium sp. M0408]|uniref:S8 family peptidase n=1 Tax=Mesorhizobium sp. M0408 TaxID=2956942 RepID=UPI00333A46EB
MRCIPAVLLASMAWVNVPSASAQDAIPGGVIAEFQQKADNSSIVWLRSDKDYSTTDIEALARKILGDTYIAEQGGEEFLTKNVGNFTLLRAFSLPVSAAIAKARIAEGNLSSEIAAIHSNSLVYGMGSECGEEEDQNSISNSESLPLNIRRVNPSPTSVGTLQKIVWIVDSGVAPGSDIASELNIVEQRLCTVSCMPEGVTDLVGHGTMIAGIIGARIGNNKEMIGVAPGVRIVALRIFTTSYPVDLLSNALAALQYINTVATAGDVVNVSFGSYYNPLKVPGATAGTFDLSNESKTEGLLRELAKNRMLFISLAAGNTDVVGGSGYVQTISPARAGGYRDPPTGTPTGAVLTVSAVRSRNQANWKDTFWKFSAYGNGDINSANGLQLGPPDFAAPGVRIRSLWPGSTANPNGQTNVCSGTSFSAAHVSGLLVYGMPSTDKRALWDPSALIPGKSPGSEVQADYETGKQDPIAKKP